ncbi:MAG TPA: PilZ domain-containing protein [Tepidisphaeraceae bacterium]|nr:PilZ domain-containing protein [Tepidisphaeraceae bacterium]
MATKYERRGESKVCTMKIGPERRRFRRHEFDHRGVSVERFDGERRGGKIFGHLVDISAGGVRIRTPEKNVKADTQIRVRLELPSYAGITPFVASDGPSIQGRHEWVGWMTVRRVLKNEDGNFDIAGPLEDMQEMDRGMLGLYLSTQPLAA